MNDKVASRSEQVEQVEIGDNECVAVAGEATRAGQPGRDFVADEGKGARVPARPASVGAWQGDFCALSFNDNCNNVPTAAEQAIIDASCNDRCQAQQPPQQPEVWGPPSCTTGTITINGQQCRGRQVCMGCNCK